MKAFDYFRKLNEIPRGSFNEEAVAKYLCEFAKELNLNFKVDEVFNVKIFKDNHTAQTIILQAHTDMVCEKLKGVEFDFLTHSINTKIENDFISALGTTLGGDDGFGVAIILEMLENCGDGYPNIEAVFTSQEESGMGGAKHLDCSDLKGQYLIGLDGTSSNELIISCAGSCRLDFEKEYEVSYVNNKLKTNAMETKKEAEIDDCAEMEMDADCKVGMEARIDNKAEMIAGMEGVHHLNYNDKNINYQNMKHYKLEVLGLFGGHSGEDINKNRANANKIGFEILNKIYEIAPLKLASVSGGGKDNAIPREFVCEFYSNLNLDTLKTIENEYLSNFKINYSNEVNCAILIDENNSNIDNECVSFSDTKDLITFICNFENGVINDNDKGEVLCSINLANVCLDKGVVKIRTMLRFNNTDMQSGALNKFTLFSREHNFKCVLRDSAPFFEVSKDKKLQHLCECAYKEC
ncbi:MAG: peptidase dimerization domain-containing protein, partial [Christensenellales bacterium]